MKALAVFFAALAALNFTQPLWADDSPVYPPWLGVVVFGPVCVLAAVAAWRARL